MWTETKEGWKFAVRDLAGELWSIAEPTICSYRVKNLRHVPSSVPLGVDTSAMGGLTLFRALARDAYLTELRATPAKLEPDGATLWVRWDVTLAHQAAVRIGYTPAEPDILDMTVEVAGHAFYPDYELLFSHYTAPDFPAGCRVRAKEFRDGASERVLPTDNPVYHGLYNFFPRDDRAARILCDGRGQRGRWYWRTAIGRSYALPLVFADNGRVIQWLLGLPDDVNAVGLTYKGDDEKDGVAGHHSMYLSLFGRDLHPGETRRARIRYQVAAPAGDRDEEVFAAFLSSCKNLERSWELVP